VWNIHCHSVECGMSVTECCGWALLTCSSFWCYWEICQVDVQSTPYRCALRASAATWTRCAVHRLSAGSLRSSSLPATSSARQLVDMRRELASADVSAACSAIGCSTHASVPRRLQTSDNSLNLQLLTGHEIQSRSFFIFRLCTPFINWNENLASERCNKVVPWPA